MVGQKLYKIVRYYDVASAVAQRDIEKNLTHEKAIQLNNGKKLRAPEGQNFYDRVELQSE